MHLNQITLLNFRNYEQATVSFNQGINIILGENAQGKTNLLEAVYFLASGKTHRTNNAEDLINLRKDFFKILVLVNNGIRENSLEVSYKKGEGKTTRINGIIKRKREDLFDQISTVFFSPDDLRIVKGGPCERREFVDEIITQIKPTYRFIKMRYVKILKQRNALFRSGLENERIVEQLSAWDEQLVSFGAKIIWKRANLLEAFNNKAKWIYQALAPQEWLTVRYQPSIGPGSSIEEIEDKFRIELEKRRMTDIELGVTSVGPHRDDFRIEVNSKDSRIHSSQGEQRCIVLSLKMAAGLLIREETETEPIFLFDDVMSELDERRRRALFNLFFKREQVIITSTSQMYFGSLLKGGKTVSLFTVSQGKVKKIGRY